MSNRSVAVLKNTNTSGSDGLLLAAVRRHDFDYVFAFNRQINGVPRDPLLLNVRMVPFSNIRWGIGRLLSQVRMGACLMFALTAREKLDRVVCGSVELAILFSLIGPAANRRYYLCSDLIPLQFSGGFVSKIVNYLERRCLNSGWIPVVTSPGFLENYHEKLMKGARGYFVHNLPRVLPTARPNPIDIGGAAVFRRRLVWAGLLRCPISCRIIAAAMEDARLEGGVSLRIAGRYASLSLENLNILKSIPTLNDFGSYQEHQIADVYNGCDIVWCCDWSLGINSESLIPNRLYHAILFGLPVIVSKGTWLEKVVRHFDIGIAVDPDLDSVVAALDMLSRHDAWARMSANAWQLGQAILEDGDGWDNILNGVGVFVGREEFAGRISRRSVVE